MSTGTNTKSKNFTINDFRIAKKNGIPVSMITCYDYAFARILETIDIDVILVGDSLGNVLPPSLNAELRRSLLKNSRICLRFRKTRSKIITGK